MYGLGLRVRKVLGFEGLGFQGFLVATEFQGSGS